MIELNVCVPSFHGGCQLVASETEELQDGGGEGEENRHGKIEKKIPFHEARVIGFLSDAPSIYNGRKEGERGGKGGGLIEEVNDHVTPFHSPLEGNM